MLLSIDLEVCVGKHFAEVWVALLGGGALVLPFDVHLIARRDRHCRMNQDVVSGGNPFREKPSALEYFDLPDEFARIAFADRVRRHRSRQGPARPLRLQRCRGAFVKGADAA